MLAPGSIVSVDPPTDLAYGSEVFVFVNGRPFLDRAGHETGVRFRLLVAKLCVLMYTDSARHNADTDKRIRR